MSEDARRFLELLFRPGETVELRVKAEDDTGARQIWVPADKPDAICKQIPVHEAKGRHIWIGVLPRVAPKSSNPAPGRTLWADFDATITSIPAAKAAIEDAALPPASLLVWSGNGVHGYWLLDADHPPEELRTRSRAVHSLLPADATHDPTRVMRLPGTINPKRGESHRCYIAEEHDFRYSLSDFPVVGEAEPRFEVKPVERDPIPLDPADRELFLDNWLDGQKHTMVLGVAGYLRKNLFWGEKAALELIEGIHREAGYEVDAGLRNDVRQTYEKAWGKVSGAGLLSDLGVLPVSGQGSFTVKFSAPKKPPIKLINFNQKMERQEFWVPGLIGPGLVTLWAAPPKTGKSFASMQIGHAVSQGLPLWDFGRCTQKRVLYFQGELTQEMVAERALDMFGTYSLRDPSQFALTDKPEKLTSLVQHPELLTDLAYDYDLIIVDPISVFMDSNENKTTEVNLVIALFDALIAQGKGVMLVHHTRKFNQGVNRKTAPTFDDIRGSGAWVARADAIALHYPWGDSGHTQVQFQFRAAPDRKPLTLFRLPHGGFTHDQKLYHETTTTKFEVPAERMLN